MDSNNNNAGSKYLSALGAWALAFGCSVGWGAFVMPGSTFLPIAGPMGTTIGIALGAVVMLTAGCTEVNRYFVLSHTAPNKYSKKITI